MHRKIHYLSKTIFIIANIFLGVLIVYFFVLGVGYSDGRSMEPELHDSDLFLVNHFIYLVHPPRRFDLIQFYQPTTSDKLLVKRVIGLPGETVSIKRGQVYISSGSQEEMVLDEPYVNELVKTYMQPNQSSSFLVPPNAYFVLGDNRIFSTDSRDFGVISRQYITGKVYAISK